MARVKIAAVVLTLNEAPRIEACLKQLRPYLNYILVLDGFSTDNTAELAQKYADWVVLWKPSSSFAKDRNYALSLVSREYEWVLFVDVDEEWNQEFLANMRGIIAKHDVLSFRFPRINLPDEKDFPDFQVRLFKNNGSIEWRGDLHEVPYLKWADKPLGDVSVATLAEYPIVHLERRKGLERSWWSE